MSLLTTSKLEIQEITRKSLFQSDQNLKRIYINLQLKRIQFQYCKRLIETFRVDDMAIKAQNGNIKELWCSQGVNNS